MSAPRICVIGAGPAGLTALQVLGERGLAAVCFERGPAVGGQWRYRNESGTSAAYASLEMMSSRVRSGLRRFPIPRSASTYPRLAEMQEYLEDFARAHDLYDDIAFDTEVVAVERTADGYEVETAGGRRGRFEAVLVANGHHSAPRWPRLPDGYTGDIVHSASYRTPEPLAGLDVVVVGCGNSALDIAGEVSELARSTIVSAQAGTHLLPKRIGPLALDWLDAPAASRIPFRLRQGGLAALLRLLGRDAVGCGLPAPDHELLRRLPTTLDGFDRLLRDGAVAVRPEIVAATGRTLTFADGSAARADRVICATGFDLSLSFLAAPRIDTSGPPLYRRIVHPDFPDLLFIGLVDPNGGLLPVLEAQCEWAADVLEGRLRLPPADDMRQASERDGRLLARRFVEPRGPSTWLLCDRWPYVRQLAADRRAAARGRPRAAA